MATEIRNNAFFGVGGSTVRFFFFSSRSGGGLVGSFVPKNIEGGGGEDRWGAMGF